MFKRKDVKIGYIVKLKDGRIMRIVDLDDENVYAIPLSDRYCFEYKGITLLSPSAFSYEDIEDIIGYSDV